MSGIDDLAALRAKAKSGRSLPPPKKPPRAAPVELPVTSDPSPTPPAPVRPAPAPEPQPAGPVQGSTGAQPAPLESAAPKAVSAAGEKSTPGPEAPEASLSRSTVYLDELTDTFIEDVIAAGRSRRPRLSISRSAVVRLALVELQQRMTATVVAQELAAKDPGTNPGRPRL